MVTTTAPILGATTLGLAPPTAQHGGLFIMCLLVLLLAGLAFYLARQDKLPRPPCVNGCRAPEDAALARLAQRFADGDMTPEDYATRVRLIREHSRPGGAPADDLGTPRA